MKNKLSISHYLKLINNEIKMLLNKKSNRFTLQSKDKRNFIAKHEAISIINSLQYKLIYPNRLVKTLIISSLSFFLLSNPSYSETKKQNIELKFIKFSQPSKLIFYPSLNNEKYIAFPKKIMYQPKNFKDPFFSNLGIPSYYDPISSRYIIVKTFYASGGSGSVDNIYIFDLKEPRVWRLATTQTISGFSSEFKFSEDGKSLITYDPLFLIPFVVVDLMGTDKTPSVSSIITNKQIENIINKKFKGKYDIHHIEGYWQKDKIKLDVNSSLKDSDAKSIDTTIIYNPKLKKFESMLPTPDENVNLYDWQKLHIEKEEFEYQKDKILSHDGKFAKVYYYNNLESNPPKRQYVFQIVRLKDYKVIYEKTHTEPKTLDEIKENDTEDRYSLNWIGNNVATINDNKSDTYLLKIKDNGDVEEYKNNNLRYIEYNNLSPNYNFVSTYTYTNNDKNKYLNIIRLSDYKTIFVSEVLTGESFYSTNFIWHNKNKFMFIDKLGNIHLCTINEQGNILDSIITNLPKIVGKDVYQGSIFSNNVGNNVCLITNNNLYYLDLEKLTASKITNFPPKKFDKENDLIYSPQNPIVAYPYITLDGKRIFYSSVIYDSLVKLMTVTDLPK